MLEYLSIVVLVGLAASWLISLAEKWGIIDYWARKTHFDLINEMLMCPFCRSWWMNVAITIVVVLYTHDLALIFVPIFSTNITKNIR